MTSFWLCRRRHLLADSIEYFLIILRDFFTSSSLFPALLELIRSRLSVPAIPASVEELVPVGGGEVV
jgi:hypothetical protein